MNPFEIRDSIIKLLLEKIEIGEEKSITKDEVEHLPLLFTDNNGNIGFPSFTKYFEEKLSKKTITEIEDFRRYL